MPTYHFLVRDGGRYDDEQGTELPDDEAAHKHGLTVIRELKRNSKSWKHWTMDIMEAGRLVRSISFDDVPGSTW